MYKILPSLLIVLLLSNGYFCYSQEYSFGYDASGNRTSRTIPLLKSTASGDENKSKVEEYSDKLKDLEIYLYPNPTKGEITVRLKNLDASEASVIYLYDNSGKLLETRTTLQELNPFDLSGYSQGIYILMITAGNQKTQWKIIKE